jgi:hypothetical protein
MFGGTWVEITVGVAIVATPPDPAAVDLYYWQRTA